MLKLLISVVYRRFQSFVLGYIFYISLNTLRVKFANWTLFDRVCVDRCHLCQALLIILDGHDSWQSNID